MSTRVQAEPFDPWQALREREGQQPAALRTGAGGAAVFVGSMRDLNQGAATTAMTLEYYPGMTERHLEKLEAEARVRWALLDVLVVHRVGPLTPGEPIVLVAVWSAHRADAFAACRYLIDELKTRAPFWKQEQTSGGPRWVAPEK
jgi:molybdopterin synthase catalytic subunit